MIEITFKDFYECKYSDDAPYELYVMKNGLGDALYIGISNQNIWDRWFGWNGHIMATDKFMIGESPVGQKIVDHLPDSWNWKIQLWTLDDCKAFCADMLNPNGNYDIRWLEPFMIQKIHPILNDTHNINPSRDTTPKSRREMERQKLLDKVYRDVFEKKK